MPTRACSCASPCACRFTLLVTDSYWPDTCTAAHMRTLQQCELLHVAAACAPPVAMPLHTNQHALLPSHINCTCATLHPAQGPSTAMCASPQTAGYASLLFECCWLLRHCMAPHPSKWACLLLLGGTGAPGPAAPGPSTAVKCTCWLRQCSLCVPPALVLPPAAPVQSAAARLRAIMQFAAARLRRCAPCTASAQPQHCNATAKTAKTACSICLRAAGCRAAAFPTCQ